MAKKKKNIELIYMHPSDLKMWARSSHVKFTVAWEEYKRVAEGGELADILWHPDGSIEIAIRPEEG
tara:strand:+ start:465 stop:662 length:198 start_codon:yes stop_codon:yes gene_type:complete